MLTHRQKELMLLAQKYKKTLVSGLRHTEIFVAGSQELEDCFFLAHRREGTLVAGSQARVDPSCWLTGKTNILSAGSQA